jgi:hypothetical protein
LAESLCSGLDSSAMEGGRGVGVFGLMACQLKGEVAIGSGVVTPSCCSAWSICVVVLTSAGSDFTVTSSTSILTSTDGLSIKRKRELLERAGAGEGVIVGIVCGTETDLGGEQPFIRSHQPVT